MNEHRKVQSIKKNIFSLVKFIILPVKTFSGKKRSPKQKQRRVRLKEIFFSRNQLDNKWG